MEDIKIYKINDCEWWISKLDKRETLDIYLDEYGLDEEDNPIEDIEECDLNNEGMWWRTEDVKDIEELGDYDEKNDLIRRGEDVFKWISFKDAIKRHGKYTSPSQIASTEY